MTRSIRKKILTSFFAVIFFFMAVAGLIAVYNQTAYHKSQKEAVIITAEMELVSGLEHAIERALMPANDYIITGDKKYKDDFGMESEAIEGLFNKLESAPALLDVENAPSVKEEKEILGEVRVSWENIKGLSFRIFDVPLPIGDPVATTLMEEMDYKWGRPGVKRLVRWHEIDAGELKEAMDGLDAAWMRSWFIMGAAFMILTAGGVAFASFYSKRFVQPITEIHNGADRLAGGDLDYRVDVRTGDEIEQLAGSFNMMGERLKEFYSVLEERVRERTRELQVERDRLESVFNAMVDGVYIVNKDYDIEYANPVLEKEFGPYEGIKCYEYFHGRTEVCPWCPNKEVFAGQTVRWEWYSSKNKRTYDLIDTPIKNPDGTVSKLEIFRDITERKRAEEEQRTIIRTSIDGFMLVDTKGNLKDVNDACCRMLGYGREELLAMAIRDIEAVEKPEDTEQHIKRIIETGHDRFETRHRCKDGKVIDVEASVNHLPIDAGKFFVFLRDITERKRAEEERKTRLEELERFHKATIAREFRIRELKEKLASLEQEMEVLKK